MYVWNVLGFSTLSWIISWKGDRGWREAKVVSFFFVKSWSLSTWYLGPGVRTVGNLQRFWELWLMDCEEETWGWLELTEKDRSRWQKLRVPSASRVSARMAQGCGKDRNKNMEKAGRTLDAQLWSIKRAEHPEVPILLLLTEGVGWMASHFLRWMDGSEVWRVLLFRMSVRSRPMRLHLDKRLLWKYTIFNEIWKFLYENPSEGFEAGRYVFKAFAYEP